MLRLLVLAELFPNRLQPWLLNWIEACLRRDCEVAIIAHGTLGESWQGKVDELGLLNKTEYYPVSGLRDAARLLCQHVRPGNGNAQRYVSGLFQILRQRSFCATSPSEYAKVIARAAAAGGHASDLIHSHTLHMAYEYLFVRETLGIPMVTTFHGMQPSGTQQISEQKLRKLFALGDWFLVNTGFARSQLEWLGCPADRISILPQGIRLEEFPLIEKSFPADGVIEVLSVGRLHADKGYEYSIRAIADLVRQGYRIRYRIVGEGPDYPRLRALIRSGNVDEHIELAGSMSNDVVSGMYRKAHIFILPSLRSETHGWEETQGVVLQEAQASGAIVVATRTGGIPECVAEGENAFLCADRDVEALVACIKRVINTPDRWQEWQVSARRHVEDNFSIDILCERLFGIYREVLSRSGKKAIGGR